ncbi:hypothetical protein GU700_17410 [Methylobacterium sp. NI91]|nr:MULTISPECIES: hypothetical protein [unclassified Methylobacterium]QIJ76211.1 hypothetical protein CLZ_17405 [Methylobacterium sp. CLZ]QIJ81116.1 hypothetical protein GU700_17410 [Methylobacterium sp. NI91]
MRNIGITGHQDRIGVDWRWVQRSLRAEFAKFPNKVEVFSSLAAGADQVFAEVAFELNIPVAAVIPLANYERFFQGQSLSSYRRLLSRSRRIDLNWLGDEEKAFFEAGKYIVKSTDVLMAVWDGKEAEGLGGTADVVGFARKCGKPVVHINPIVKSVEHI